MHKLKQKLSAFAAGMLLASGALAQAYPSKPVTVLVGFGPGSGNDLIIRTMQPKLAEFLGQSIVVDNRDGASSNIAMDAAAKAKPDGYTMIIASSSWAINVYTLAGSHPLSDYTPMARIGVLPFAAMMNNDVPARNIKELAALVKANPGKYFAAAGGPTGAGYLTVQTFRHLLGADMDLVAYKGSPEAMTDLFSGRVHVLFANVATALPLYKSGKLKILAITGDKRNANVPDVATFTEQGYPDLNIDSWYALMGPAGVPRPVVNRVNEATNKTLAVKDVQDKLKLLAVEIMPGTPDELAAYLKNDTARWDKLTKMVGANIVNK